MSAVERMRRMRDRRRVPGLVKRDQGRETPVTFDERADWAQYITRGRKSRGWTQRQLSCLAGVSLETVQKFESGNAGGRTAAAHVIWTLVNERTR